MLDTIRAVQIYPSHIRIETNDKDTKVLFGINDENFQDLINGGSRNIVETRNHKKLGTVRSPYTVTNSDGYDNKVPLNEFDRAVLSACISEWRAGNPYITPAMIFRSITGKVGTIGNKIRANQEKDISDSIEKLMFTNFNRDNQRSLEQLRYCEGDDEIKIKSAAILPAVVVDVKINGQLIENAIFFTCESPVLTVADQKNQIVRYDVELLNVPNQNNTLLVISLKNYVMRRICEIKLHKNLARTLTWDNIFHKCRISDANDKTKHDARATVIKLFENLLNKGFIKSFTLAKKFPDSKRSYGISFTF